ncbi:MAG: tetratricopeptide repeat protein [Candidatus Kariarchaeaceae archaeon]|jgi:chromosome segregation ATPase
MNSSINYFDGINAIYDSLHLGKLDQAVKTSQELDKLEGLTPKQISTRDIAKAKVLVEIGDTNEAVNLLNNTLETLELSTEPILFVSAQSTKATALVMFGELGKAKSLTEEVEKAIAKMSDGEKKQSEEVLAEIKNINGLIYNNQGELEAALMEYKESMIISKRLNLRKELGMINFNMASVYKLQNNLSLSLTFFEQALEIFKEIDYNEAQSTTLKNLEEIHRFSGDDDLSFVYKQKRDNLADKVAFKKFQLEATIKRSSMEREIERLNAENIELEKQLWSYKFELDASDQTSDDSRTLPGTMLQATSDELEKTRKELEKVKAMYEEVRSELSNSKSEMRETETRVKIQMEEQLAEANAVTSKVRQELEAKESELNESQKKKIELLQELDGVKKENKELTTKNASLELLNQDLRITEELYNKIKHQESQFEDKSGILEERVATLEKSLRTANETIDRMKKEGSSDLNTLREQYEAEIANYKEKLLPKTDEGSILSRERINELEKELERTKSEMLNYKERFDKTEKELDKAKFDIEKPIKQTKIPLDPRPAPRQALQSPVASITPLHTRGLPGTIEDILNKDRLARKIADILEQRPRIQLRMLSMQLGTSPAKILDTVRQLEAKGYVTLKFAYREDPNPVISKSR